MMENKFYDYQISRKSSNIMSYVKQSGKAFTIDEIVTSIFNVNKNNARFKYYFKAVESFIRANKDFNEIQDGLWSYGSSPIIRPTVVSTSAKPKQVSHLVLYAERVKGFIRVSQQMASLTRMKVRKQGVFDVDFDGYTYEFHWKWIYNYCYLFGNGVMDFFADAGLQPNQEFIMNIDDNKKITLTVPRLKSDVIIPDQSQLSQIEDSFEFAKGSSKFTILYELLSCYPSGLTMNEIFKHYLDMKVITTYELKNLLKQNECFQYDVVEDTWKVYVNKISRYYKDELGDQAENKLSFKWLIGEDDINDAKASHEEDEDKKILDKDVQPQSDEESKDEIVNASTSDEFSIESIINEIVSLTLNPSEIKQEIDNKVVECFMNGDIKSLEDNYKEAQEIYSYFQKVDQFMNKWKGQDLNG